MKRHKTFMEIEYKDKYKYLGSWLYNSLDPRKHISEITSHISFIAAKLSPIRRRGDLKTNINLFKVLILTKIKMNFCYFDLCSNKQQQDIVSSVRRAFKFFCCLPKSCSNKVIDELFGNITTALKNESILTEYRLVTFTNRRQLIK